MSRPVLILCLFLVAAVSGTLGFVAAGGGRVAIGDGGPPRSFAEIVERVNPAVVHITVVSMQQAADGTPGVARRGEGSGFIIDAEGYILTNHHLVTSPERIRVRLTDRREFAATLVGSDPSTDLALLKVKASGLPTVRLGDSDHTKVGDWVCAIGNPYRFDHSVTVGVVSSLGRKIYDASFDAYIQTDAAINPGNSGGPLINAKGEAIGVNSAMSVPGQGIGFAVPINVAREILVPLRTQGRVTRGYLGIQLQELDPDLQRLMKLPEGHGAVVLDVIAGGAGESAGLKRYDVITDVSGRAVDDGDQLVRAIAARPPGSSVMLTVYRDGRKMSMPAKLSERGPEEEFVEDESDDEEEEGEAVPVQAGDPLGVVTDPLTPGLKAELRIPDDRVGVLVRDVVGLAPGVDALSQGDVIVEVNRVPTPTAAAYAKVLGSLQNGELAWLFVYRPRPAGSFLTKVEVETK
jgi:serine protease Do